METDGFGHGDARKLIGMTLWLESYAATLLAALPIGTIVVRTIIGEQFLRRKLQGYDADTQTVRCRLVPFLW
jgi:protein-S-isoprenylcysteine O-methyltransferase Ste14